MRATTGHKTKGERHDPGVRRRSLRALPALIAVTGLAGLLTHTAAALELGELKIDSALGQPLRASIPYTLSPNEQLFDFCVFLRPGAATTGAPTISRPKITLDNGNILLAGNTPILEPVLTMQLSVSCPYTARLAREYTLMMSPMTIANAQANAEANAEAEARAAIPPSSEQNTTLSKPVASQPAQRATARAPAAVASPSQNTKPTPVVPLSNESAADNAAATRPDPININSRYFVQRGDSLSALARRIENRPIGVWPTVRAIHAANPDAFVDGDINQLNAAVWIFIPSLATAENGESSVIDSDIARARAADSGISYTGFDAADAPVSAETADTDLPATVDFVDEVIIAPIVDVVEEVVQSNVTEQSAAVDSTPEPAEDSNAITAIDSSVAESIATPNPAADVLSAEMPVDDTEVLRPGEVAADPVVIEPVVAPVTNAAEGVVRSAPVVRRVATPAGSGVPMWILVAAGGAIALAVAWFAFGTALRERFTTPPATTSDAAGEFVDDPDITAKSPVVDDVDFQFDDDEIGSQSISLDADLGAGTGLQDSDDLDVAQDFGFSGTSGENEGSIDLEFPQEPVAEPEPNPTDIIEPSHRIEDVLVTEETPAAEDTQASAAVDDGGDYDFSMIVDATRQPVHEEVTAMDLMAVRVDDDDLALDIGGQTLASDVDIAILEQDYEDEFTQTQALNDEIAKAAEELALRMQEDEDTAEVTSRIEQVEDPAMTATVQAPVEAGNDDLTEIADLELTEIADFDRPELSDLEDTSLNLQLTENLQNPGNEITVAMPQPDTELTVEMAQPNNEPTVEMANPGNDATVEMPLDSDIEGSKEPKAS